MVRSPADDEAAAARGRRILRLPAPAPGARDLNRLVVTADDFGLARRGQRRRRARASLRHSDRRQPDGGGARRRRRGRARAPPAGPARRAASRAGRGPPGAAARAHSRSGRCERRFAHRHGAARARPRAASRRCGRSSPPRSRRSSRPFAATGLPLDHVNAHKHFHLHPIIAAQMIRIGRRFGARAIRVPREPAAIIDAIEPGAAGWSGRVAGTVGEDPAGAGAPRRARRRPTPCSGWPGRGR